MSQPSRELDAAFGSAVRAARETLGISQEELAHRAGLHRTYISQLERGTKSPTLGSMARIAEGLGVSLDALVQAALTRTAAAT